ncbi:Ribonuclease HII [hydrothermal vent metagenome]|uniref:Ribonuclease HII n=1 Tax=hydrothermal vent metagenome TaxID=652676 RepID=A0A3B0VK04_9ZZZZ
MQVVVGIDEAGRGPLAGPVSVGAVSVQKSFDVKCEFPGVADSKKLSEKKREIIFSMLEKRLHIGDVHFAVGFSSAQYIDKYGISQAIKRALSEAVNAVAPEPHLAHVFLDGSLSAPSEYLSQETIIHGDDLVPVISLASIVAKVTRDRIMVDFAKKYPQYGFERHKGYGTLLHRSKLKECGLCDIHRRTFIH